MGNDQPALWALFACKSVLPSRTGNRAGARVRSFDLANKAQQMGKMAKFARCPVCKNNCKLL